MTTSSSNTPKNNATHSKQTSATVTAPQPQTRHIGTGYGRSSGYARSNSYQRDFSGFKYL
jgi:hypothetical protein